MNVVSINILFQDLFKTIIRNLSTQIGVAGAVGAEDFAEGGNNSIVVGFPDNKPNAKLYVEYLRLPSWRAQSGTALLQTFRIACHDPTHQKVEEVQDLPATCSDKNAVIEGCLRPTGIDRYGGNACRRNRGHGTRCR